MAKILIADDEPEVTYFCKVTLEREHHNIVTAQTGPETLEKLNSEKPDLLILDVMLPDMDGYTLQLRMSEDERFFRIPVIVISALKSSLEMFGKFAQVSSTIPKPFLGEDLVKAVNKALSDERIKDMKYRPYR